jgi:hypothetical protein
LSINERLGVKHFDRLLNLFHILGQCWAIVSANACDVSQVQFERGNINEYSAALEYKAKGAFLTIDPIDLPTWNAEAVRGFFHRHSLRAHALGITRIRIASQMCL